MRGAPRSRKLALGLKALALAASLLTSCTECFDDSCRESDSAPRRDADADADVDADACLPNCGELADCGDDGCGGFCGELGGACPAGWTCGPDRLCFCDGDCEGRECGYDRCGNPCGGECPPDEQCDNTTGTCFEPMDPRCIVDSGFGAPCGADECLDGSTCWGELVGGGGGVCMPECETIADCPDVAPGPEICGPVGLLPNPLCAIECSSAADCPCGLPCRSILLARICVP